MEILLYLINQENYLAKREGMKIVHELLMKKDQNKDFYNYFISSKEHLKFTMTSLNDDSTAIQIEAFHLLLIFLSAPEESRGQKVNETLKKNFNLLIDFVESFLKDSEKDDEHLESKKKKAIQSLKKMRKAKE